MPAHVPDTVDSSHGSPISDTVNAYRLGCGDLEQSLEELFNDLDAMRMQLEQRANDLAQREGQVSNNREEISRLMYQYEQQEARLAETQQELAQAHVELARIRKAGKAPLSGDSSQKLSEVEQERAELETELENVRGRAAELHETVAEQKREMEAQRNEMNSEIKQLRKILENMASGSARQPEAAPPQPAQTASPVVNNPPSDPVVNSVMAQFAKLQKDVAQRRARNKT